VDGPKDGHVYLVNGSQKVIGYAEKTSPSLFRSSQVFVICCLLLILWSLFLYVFVFCFDVKKYNKNIKYLMIIKLEEQTSLKIKYNKRNKY
jgi:hypothetical protein